VINVDFVKEAAATVLIVLAGEGADGAVDWTPPAAALDSRLGGALARGATEQRFAGRPGQALDLASPVQGLSRVLAMGVGPLSKASASAVEMAAAHAVKRLLASGQTAATLVLAGCADLDNAECASAAGFGAKLAGYRFDKYRTKLSAEKRASLKQFSVATTAPEDASARFLGRSAVADGVYLARDLMTEPPNVLFPEEFARRARALSELGVSVEVLGEKEMAALGMGSLLGVGQGSVRESQLVVMKWMGQEGSSETPLALVGKGVCFDSGGISLKPGEGMQDMKGDMGGAAAVTGALLALAKRKAKANVIGILGLVENMPDANAQRPGDIVTSMSGQTIEIINTDAEGRLVLCDALTYVQRTHKPTHIVDLATLTGAIIISLGHDHAGLFSNNDDFAEAITKSAKSADEPVWRLPQGKSYDKLIDSQFADMKNTGGRAGGSITAAQFLGRFIEGDTAWAHIDIAGTAWKPTQDDPRENSWATGYGVRLLDRLVADQFEH
jgi:leucyl aminopeptidase